MRLENKVAPIANAGRGSDQGKVKRLLLAAILVLGTTFIFSLVSYAVMLERQEGRFWLFMRAAVQTSFDSSREAMIADQSGRFLIRGSQADVLRIAQGKNWTFVDQMGALTNFQAEGQRFAVDCHQYTRYFIVCKKL